MKITCPNCNHEIDVNAASLMGKQKKTMSPAATEQRRKAGAATKAKWAAIRAAKKPSPSVK